MVQILTLLDSWYHTPTNSHSYQRKRKKKELNVLIMSVLHYKKERIVKQQQQRIHAHIWQMVCFLIIKSSDVWTPFFRVPFYSTIRHDSIVITIFLLKRKKITFLSYSWSSSHVYCVCVLCCLLTTKEENKKLLDRHEQQHMDVS